MLLVEDNPGDAKLLEKTLSHEPGRFELTCVEHLSAALEHLAGNQFDVALLDLSLPDSQGLDTFIEVNVQAPEVPIVVLTGLADDAVAERAMRTGAQDYLMKGEILEASVLRRSIRYAIERKRADAAIKESQRNYQDLVNSLDGVLWEADARDLRFTFVSNQCERILGHTVEYWLGGMTWKDVVHPDDLDHVLSTCSRAARQKQGCSLEFRLVASDCRVVWMRGQITVVSDNGDVVMLRGFMIDITESKSMEAELQQAQKMEAIGRLAGGVAHDFNNIMSAILGYAQLGLRTVPYGGPLRSYLQEIQSSTELAAGLTRQLLAFSRRQVIEPRAVVLNELILNMDKMLRRVIGEDVELVILPGSELGQVKVDPGQMEQVLVNLAVNARDAMPEGGTLIIETSEMSWNEDLADLGPGMNSGRCVVLTVRDTGVGMTDEVKSHVFEPFYSTKEHHEGSGLGMSTCYGIVTQAGGHIAIESEPSNGTIVRIYLPRIGNAARPSQAADEFPELTSAAMGETVLLAEDEPSVRTVVAEMLRNAGYTVLEAANGEEALRLAERHDGVIDLLLTDLVMPLMGGKVLAEELRKRSHVTRVVFTSGYSDDQFAHGQELEPGVVFMQKPFTPTTLTRKVREALRAPSIA